MSEFKKSTQKFIQMHGRTMTFSRIVEGTYDVETGTASNTATTTSLKIYRKHVKANQYNYPTLVNKDVAEFYIYAPDLASAPEPKDTILDGSELFTVEAIQKHEALGEILLYVVAASKG